MKIKDSFSGLIEFFKEFSKVKSGLIGIFIILIFLILMILEPVILPYKETNEKWRDISYWQDNPSNAAPVWTQLFSKEKKPPTKFIYKYEQSTG
ncbi:MAG TPA: ABC transporter permease, partial [Exilispira sp.]|nr:ABC transporter permease [Exilispira sp.]